MSRKRSARVSANIADLPKCLLLALAWALCLQAAAWAQSGEREHFLVKIGVAYDRADFEPAETSRAVFVPITFRYLGQNFDIGVTPSFAAVDTTGGVRLIDGVPVSTGETASERRSGPGDTVIRGRYYLHYDAGGGSVLPGIAPFARLKIPTAPSDLNLGTGEPDFGFGFEWDKRLTQRLLLFGDVSYTLVGKIPGENMRNRPGASFGIGGGLTPSVSASGMIDWRQSVFEGNSDLADLVGFLSFQIGRAVSFSPNIFIGLTSSSSDFGAGFELSYRFGRY